MTYEVQVQTPLGVHVIRYRMRERDVWGRVEKWASEGVVELRYEDGTLLAVPWGRVQLVTIKAVE